MKQVAFVVFFPRRLRLFLSYQRMAFRALFHRERPARRDLPRPELAAPRWISPGWNAPAWDPDQTAPACPSALGFG